jgi:hypothetical protein
MQDKIHKKYIKIHKKYIKNKMNINLRLIYITVK